MDVKSTVFDLSEALHELEKRYQTAQAIAADPIVIPRSFSDPHDQELIAWVAAHLAYGKVSPMIQSIKKGISPLGPSPATWLRQLSPHDANVELTTALKGWKWRFHTDSDLVEWILTWKRLDEESLGQGVEMHLMPSREKSPSEALSHLVQRLRKELSKTHGIRFTLPDPLEGAACKRWRMFLRWMVRTGWPDLGLWKGYPTSSLVVPLDTHVARVANLLGLSIRKSADGRMAQEITDTLRKMDPKDPLRFDFALSHLGILGDCPGKHGGPSCAGCPLKGFCQ